ncbi:type IV secretion system DNA-binding domain-containing protein [Streptomyces profundus]|uniref:type IV secretion system DNA-binding domain-containing protein n=1 Tax=Streptomyces profundus TaxID=2867410 RepID=UPI001D15E950|nr:type IV secretion system DNA-binding domain-containing protein [Streptomyces sp. MA3_2.13]UED85294.1 type IV secretion system DNA-binding domain-containing protein [Streptomyces sp. MA3_2.13]
MSSNNKRPAVDWTARHGALSGTINAAAGTLVTTSLAHSAGVPPTWAAVVGAAGAVGTAISGLRRRMNDAGVAFRSVCCLAAGSWSSAALAGDGPLTMTALGSLAVGATLAGTLGAGVGAHETTEQARRATALRIGTRRQMAVEWVERLARVCRIEGAEIVAIEQWPTGMGYTIEVKLPAGGTTRKAISDRTAALASDLDLPSGCGVAVHEGVTRRLALVKVTTKSMAGQAIAFPVEEMAEVTTINNPVPLALLSDGGQAELDLRQASTIVTGTTGTGKTNWLHSLIARLNQTNDSLVWVIDLNGGSLGLPWLHAWREAQNNEGVGRWSSADIPAPGVDWVASTVGEAKKMLAAAVRIAKARKVAYQDAMRDKDDDKLPVGPTLPEIVIIVDEGAEVAATREAAKVLAGVAEVIRIARAMAIRAVISALRVTQDVLPDPMVRKMASNRVSTGATEDAELGHLFGWRALSVEESFDGPGSLLVGTDGKAPARGRAPRITPGQIEEVCAATSSRRPQLDKPSLDAAGTDYTQRWLLDRCGHLWSQPATTPAGNDSGPAGGGGKSGPKWSATADWDTPREPTLHTPTPDELEAMFNAPTADRTANSAQGQDDDTDWSDPTTWTTGHQDTDQPDAKQAALQLVLAAGSNGTGASAMERALKGDFGTRRPVIQRWLKEWAEAGEIVRVGEGTKARYVHRTHVSDDPNQD